MSRPPDSEPRPSTPSPSRSSRARCTRAGLSRALRRGLRAACGAATLALLPGACAEDPPRPPASVDAGQECELGTRNCACIGGVRCDDDLVCIAGRCSLSLDEPPSVEPGSRPRRPPAGPELPEPDAGAPTVDASAPAPDAPDASGGDGGPDAGD